jgi:Tfp pilus assembly protein PilN
MINLIPTTLKAERKYGRLNLLIAKLLGGVMLISALAALVMLSGLQLTKADQKFHEESITIKTAAYEEVRAYEEQSSALKTRTANIKKLFEREVKFSKLLVDIASSIPVGAQLTDLALTGTSTEPLQITANVQTQDLSGVLRKNLVDSGIFESADVQNVSFVQGVDGQPNTYTVSLSASLAGSTAKIKAKAAAEKAAAEAQAAAEAEKAKGESQ